MGGSGIRANDAAGTHLMQQHFTAVDWLVLAVYFAGTMSIGTYFWRKSRSTEGFTAGGRSMPGWACGLSIFATYVSSISFLALPGKAYASNWNPFVFSLSLPAATWIAVRWFLPYYRRSGEVSAYASLERRFGPWARVYASSFYLLTQVARMGAVMYLMALPLSVLLGWDIRAIILITGVSVTAYSFVGGIIAVIWTDSLQAIVLMGGAVTCVAVMLAGMPGGAMQVFTIAAEHGKFSLGSFGPSLDEATFWVILAYGFFTNLQNFGIDQGFIQRYIASASDREAKAGLWLGGLLYVPISALFFFIGTTLFAFYETHPADFEEVRQAVAAQQLANEGILPDAPHYEAERARALDDLTAREVGDKVFPHFIGKHLPAGVTGLLIAAIFAAAMSTVSTSLNSSATLLMSDYWRRFVHRNASERESLVILCASTIAWGLLGTAMAFLLVRLTESALDIWWELASIFSGGIVGLFLLGMVSRARNREAVAGTLVGIVVILWMVLSPNWGRLPGSVIVKGGSREVAGLHTDFAERLAPGDTVRIDGRYCTVASIAADGLSLTLAEPFAGGDAKKIPIHKPDAWTRFQSPFHTFLVIVVGTLTILLVGLIGSRFARFGRGRGLRASAGP